MINQDSILKSRDITLLTKVYMVKAMVFPVVMRRWELDHKEGWALKNWCFQTGRKRLLRVPWTARSNQFILKERNPEYLLDRLMLKLKLQHFGHLLRWADSLEKTLMLRKTEGRRRSGWQRMRWSLTLWTWIWANSRRWRTEKPGVLQSTGSQRVGHDWVNEQQHGLSRSRVQLWEPGNKAEHQRIYAFEL